MQSRVIAIGVKVGETLGAKEGEVLGAKEGKLAAQTPLQEGLSQRHI
jgi:hypothetical protein